jgi:predicted PurR-regulated permease PerM
VFFGALKAWLVARSWNALIVGGLWFIGLSIIGIPWAALWAVLGAVLQFIPNFGVMIALIGPEFAAMITGQPMKMLYVLMLYAVVTITDAWVLEPVLMKKTARVPVWASIITPIVLGILWPFWGVLIAPPLLAVVFAFRQHQKSSAALITKQAETAPRGPA